jgi:multidrug efflux pump subunit AcrB
MTAIAAATVTAHGKGHRAGAEMLRPLATAVIGALFISVLVSLIATPVVYYLLMRLSPKRKDRLA